MAYRRIIAVAIIALLSPVIAGNCPKRICDFLRSKGLGIYLAPDTDITKIGDIRFKDMFYTVYYYDHADVETKHGRQAIIIIKNDRIYVGGYDATDADKCRIKNKSVICNVPNGTGDRINFTRNGPPYRISFSGSITSLDNLEPQFIGAK